MVPHQGASVAVRICCVVNHEREIRFVTDASQRFDHSGLVSVTEWGFEPPLRLQELAR